MKVSVIIPVYNAERYLPIVFSSLDKQTYTDFEVILIDDGSTDKSYKLCEEYKSIRNNVVLIRKENGGSASARNVGLREASGEYIAFIDADDWVVSSYFQELVTLLESYNADIAVCDFVRANYYRNTEENSKTKKVLLKNNMSVLKEFCQRKTYLHIAVLWNKLYKKELFTDIFFPEGRYIDDEYVIYKLIYRANKIVFTEKKLYYYYMSEYSQMRSVKSLKVYDKLEMIDEQRSFFENLGKQELLELFLFRYYALVIDLYNLFIKEFPEENKKLQQLFMKRKGYWKVFFSKYVPLQDKVSLLMRRFLPKLFGRLKYAKGSK